MANLKSFTLDQEKASKGIRVPFDDKTTFIIGSINSREYERAFANESKPFRHPAKKHLLDNPDTLLKLQIKCIAKTVLLGWEGLDDTNEAGEVVNVPYSVETAIQVLNQSPEIRGFVIDEASKSANFNLASQEVASENLKSVS